MIVQEEIHDHSLQVRRGTSDHFDNNSELGLDDTELVDTHFAAPDSTVLGPGRKLEVANSLPDTRLVVLGNYLAVLHCPEEGTVDQSYAQYHNHTGLRQTL